MSYITVSADKVIQCCQNYTIYNENRKAQRAAIILADKAKERKYWLFGPEIGYQAAFDHYMNGDDFTSLRFHSCFWTTETDETVKNLLNLARNGDPVMLSDKHAFIFNFEDITFERVE
jgi:hypothetical protein